MSIYRIATANSFDNTLLNLSKRQSDLATAQDRLSSGKRVLKASDDAVAATLAERAQNRLSRVQSDLRALEASRTALTQAESALGEATDIMHRARELVVQAGDPVLSANSRKDLALQLEGLREQMLAVANRKDASGLTLFGGLGGAEQPFSDLYGPNAGVQFQGQKGQYSPTESSLPQAIDGNAAWMRVNQGNGTFLSSLNQANLGAVNLAAAPAVAEPGNLPSPADAYRVEFLNDAANGGQLSYQVVNATSGAIEVPLTAYDPNTPPTVNIPGPGGGPYAPGTFDLSFTLQGIAQAGDVVQINPELDGTGNFDHYAGVADGGNTGGLRSSLGSFSGTPAQLATFSAGLGYEVEFVTDTTFRIRDRTNGGFLAIDGATPVPPSTDTYTYERDKDFSFQGLTLQLQGTPKTGDRLSLEPVVSQPGDIFQTLQNAIDALRYSGDNQGAHLTQELGRTLQEMDVGLDTLTVARGRVGDWLNRADTMDNLFKDREVFHQKEQSELTDLDLVKGISEFQTHQLALDAALKSYSQVQRLSLFQYIA